MERSDQIVADAVLLIHAGIVLFNLVLVCVGGIGGWAWIGNRWFYLAHLGGIIIAMFQALLGIYCPLTILKMWLRQQAQLANRRKVLSSSGCSDCFTKMHRAGCLQLLLLLLGRW